MAEHPAGALSLGRLAIPADYDVVVEATLRASAPEAGAPLLAGRAHDVKEPPRPCVIIGRRRAPPDGDAFLASFLRASAASTRGLSVAELAPFAFDDGARAPCFEVQLLGEVPLTQRHVARVDDGVLTHFVLAAAAGQTSAIDALAVVVRAWTPA